MQWTYRAYLGAIKEANGAAMSIGRISTFLDVYIERDLKKRHIAEDEVAGTDRSDSCRSYGSSAFSIHQTTMRCSAAIHTGQRNVSAA